MHRRTQSLDARCSCIRGEAIGEERADASVLPLVGDGDRHFGLGAVPHEPPDPHRLTLDDGDENVVVAVDP
jgi:hypothetical protein